MAVAGGLRHTGSRRDLFEEELTTNAVNRLNRMRGASRIRLHDVRAPAVLEGCIMKDLTEFIFQTFDKNGSGRIEGDELIVAMRSLGLIIEEEQVDEILAQYDRDRDGSFDLNEFTKIVESFVVKMHDAKFEEKLQKAFNVLDKDNSGFLDRAELEQILVVKGRPHSRLKPEAAQALLAEFDSNLDGKISVDELTRLMLHGHLVGFMKEMHAQGKTLTKAVAPEEAKAAATADGNAPAPIEEGDGEGEGEGEGGEEE
ncbi:unnamed protein product [Pedinophyceae sp. YPF-701]|nr:unnamed protein product [Pedinophyceae sp. YPF-701]